MSIKQYPAVKLKITHQGGPIVESAILWKRRDVISCVELNLKSKYCDVNWLSHGSDGTCGLSIGASERGLFLKKGKEDKPTMIEFPEFNGYEIYATNTGRYSIQLVLIKKSKR